MGTQSSDYTFASAQAATISASVGILQLQDRGHSYWRRVASPPVHAGKFRSQDRYLPDGTTHTTNGGYWEFSPVDGIIDVEEWGLAGDGATDNSSAMGDLLAYIVAKRVNTFEGNGGGYRIRFPIGDFYFSSGIELKATVIIEGQGSGMAHGVSTKLRFGTGGVVVNTANTLDGGVETTPTTAASATIIRNLLIASTATTGNYDGIWLRGRATIDQVYVSAFPRHGIRIEAEGTNASNPALAGNANNWRVINCRLDGNGDCGLFVSGGDTNAGIGIGIDTVANGNWGIWDNSFLGNAYLGCHADLNGVPGSSRGRTAPSAATYNGRIYAVVPGQDSAASTTTPGTNDAIWFEFWSGEAIAGAAAWSSGSTYKSGGAYAIIGNAATGGLLDACYSEGSQSPSFVGQHAVSINGTHGAGIGGPGCITRGYFGILWSRRGFVTETDKEGGNVTVGGNPLNGDILRIGHPIYSVASHRLQWKSGKDLSFNYNSGIGTEPFFMTGPATTTTFGTAAPQPHVFALDKLALGAGYNGEGDGLPGRGRRITYRSAAPASGEWARGDFVFNLYPSGGAPLGWRCTAAGAPGTWEAVASSASPTFTGTLAAADINATGRVDAGNVVSVGGGSGFTSGNRLHLFYGGGGFIQAYNSGTATYLPITINGSQLSFAIGLTTIMTMSSAGMGIDVAGEARCDSLRIDVAATAAAVTQTHHVPISINGVTYKLLLAS